MSTQNKPVSFSTAIPPSVSNSTYASTSKPSESQEQWLRDQITELVGEQLGIEECDIKDNSRFVQDLGGGSLDQVELILTIEDAFSVEFSSEEAEGKDTVAKLIQLLHDKLSNSTKVTNIANLYRQK